MRIPALMSAALLLFAAPLINASEFEKPAEDAMNPAPIVALNTYQRSESDRLSVTD
jgi:hypothetical protein